MKTKLVIPRKGIMKLLIMCLIICLMPLQAFCEDDILIGLIPEENVFHQMDRYRPLATYLSEKLGITVRMTILSRYGDIIDRFNERKLDGAFFEIFTGVLAMDKLQVEPVARPVNLNGKATEQSYLFVRKDSGINTVADMKGKSIALRTGYCHWLYLHYTSETTAEEPCRYFRTLFAGSHGSRYILCDQG
jgi:phosphonate transport system substrate-binding protein